MRTSFILIITFFCFVKGIGQGIPADTAQYLLSGNNDYITDWHLSKSSDNIVFTVSSFSGINDNGLAVFYNIPSGGGWVNMDLNLTNYPDGHPIVFYFYNTDRTGYIELKFSDSDGSVTGLRIPMDEYAGGWNHITVYPEDTEYWWGGDPVAGDPVKFSIAFSSQSEESNTVYFDETGTGKSGLQTSFPSTLDPNRDLPGTGFLQRRHVAVTPEDPLVLEFLKHLQDLSSSSQKLVPNYAGGTEAQTFNNSLTALAFITKNEKERAERILDFYQQATDSNNTDIKKQNFFYLRQPRGFYQNTHIETYTDPGKSDRWIGDMAWLFFACRHYQEKYTSDRYEYLMKLIRDLFVSFYQETPIGGYIGSGWRKGDESLHESNGHPEGNIDCYAVFKLYGEDNLAKNIKTWIDSELEGKTSLPLDLYTWRCLAFGALDEVYRLMPDMVEHDFRYRKIINVNGTDVMGFYSEADLYTDNFWNDGTGHASCAYQAYGDAGRGYFYANQLDPLIRLQNFGSDTTHGIPYTLNKEGYEWVDTSLPAVSSSAWYILAKNGINPFLSAGFTSGENQNLVGQNQAGMNLTIYPNPVQYFANICFSTTIKGEVKIEIIPASGFGPISSFSSDAIPGTHCLKWQTDFSSSGNYPAGIYLVKFSQGYETIVWRMIVINSGGDR